MLGLLFGAMLRERSFDCVSLDIQSNVGITLCELGVRQYLPLCASRVTASHALRGRQTYRQ